MNKKACFTWIMVAFLLFAGLVANGYLISQQMVNFLSAQEDAFNRAMQSGVQTLDRKD